MMEGIFVALLHTPFLENGAAVLLPETTDLGRAINEFIEINAALDMPREDRKFEGAVVAHVIADKLNDLPPQERHRWLMTLLAYLAEATNLAYLKGVEVERMLIPSEN